MNRAAKHELHPLCTLFPRLSGAEFDSLRDDIKANGLREPITLHEGMILDGGNRYAACVAAGVTPTFKKFAGGSIVSFVLSANLHRRHMTAGQQAAIVAAAQDWAQAQVAGSNQHKARTARGPATLPDHLATTAARAAESGASERTQRMADKVAKADPALVKKVAHGEVSLPQAVRQISPPKPTPAPAPVDDGPDDLVQELEAAHAEIEKLTAEIKAAEADDLKAEAMKWRRSFEHSQRQQSEAMDRAKRATDREAWTMRQLRRCGKAIGIDDPTKIAATVEAFVREHTRKAA